MSRHYLNFIKLHSRLSLSLIDNNTVITSPNPNNRSPDTITVIAATPSLLINKDKSPRNIAIDPITFKTTDTALLDSGVCSSASSANLRLFGLFITDLQLGQNFSPSLTSLPHHSHFIKHSPFIKIYNIYRKLLKFLNACRYILYIFFFKGSVFMSEETKQEEVKEEVNKPDDNKEESNVVSIFLYFAGTIGMIAVFLLSMAISNEYIDEPAIILLIGIVSAFISGMPIIGIGKIVDLLSEIKKNMK